MPKAITTVAMTDDAPAPAARAGRTGRAAQVRPTRALVASIAPAPSGRVHHGHGDSRGRARTAARPGSDRPSTRPVRRRPPRRGSRQSGARTAARPPGRAIAPSLRRSRDPRRSTRSSPIRRTVHRRRPATTATTATAATFDFLLGEVRAVGRRAMHERERTPPPDGAQDDGGRGAEPTDHREAEADRCQPDDEGRRIQDEHEQPLRRACGAVDVDRTS